MAVPNPCAVLQGLVDWEMKIIRALNKKFAALRRLAELLEQLGDISSFLPNINQLIPVIDIDIDVYTALQVNCPFLNLPPATNEDINSLRSKLNEAYAKLASQILNHPWMRMDKVQKMLNDYQQKLNYPYGEDYIRCLNSVCAAIGTVGSLLEKASTVDIGKELATFSQNFVDNAGQVLTKSMQTKRDEAMQVYNQVLDLRDDTVSDFKQPGAPATTDLRTGHATVPSFTFTPTTFQTGFPASFPTSSATTPPGVGSVIPRAPGT